MSLPSEVIINRNQSIKIQSSFDLWSIQKQEQDLIIWQNPGFRCMDFFMKCANVAFSVVLGKGDRDAENWNRIFQYGRLFWLRLALYTFQSDLPSTHDMTCWKWSSYKHRVCPSIHPSVCQKLPWVHCEHNSSYSFVPIFLKLCRLFSSWYGNVHVVWI